MDTARTRRVLIVCYPALEELNAIGPWEVFGYQAAIRPDLCAITTTAQRAGELECAKGLRIVPDTTFATAPSNDVLIVPGGRARARRSTTRCCWTSSVSAHAALRSSRQFVRERSSSNVQDCFRVSERRRIGRRSIACVPSARSRSLTTSAGSMKVRS